VRQHCLIFLRKKDERMGLLTYVGIVIGTFQTKFNFNFRPTYTLWCLFRSSSKNFGQYLPFTRRVGTIVHEPKINIIYTSTLRNDVRKRLTQRSLLFVQSSDISSRVAHSILTCTTTTTPTKTKTDHNQIIEFIICHSVKSALEDLIFWASDHSSVSNLWSTYKRKKVYYHNESRFAIRHSDGCHHRHRGWELLEGERRVKTAHGEH